MLAGDQTLQTALISLVLVAATILIHYETLRFTSSRLTHLKIAPQMRLVLMLTAALLSHIAQVMLYALAFIGLEEIGGFGSIDAPRDTVSMTRSISPSPAIPRLGLAIFIPLAR